MLKRLYVCVCVQVLKRLYVCVCVQVLKRLMCVILRISINNLQLIVYLYMRTKIDIALINL